MQRLLTIMLITGAITIAAPIHSAFAFYEEGGGIINRFSYVTADDMTSTTSPNFVEVPNMSVEAKTMGRGPVIINFCAATNAGGSGSVAVTVAVDGVNEPFGMAGGGGVQFAATSYTLPHCFTWVISELEPGEHTFSIRWRKHGGSTGYMQSRTLIVKGM